jgi:hypothetical protein
MIKEMYIFIHNKFIRMSVEIEIRAAKLILTCLYRGQARKYRLIREKVAENEKDLPTQIQYFVLHAYSGE